jgi:hypothetical protein
MTEGGSISRWDDDAIQRAAEAATAAEMARLNEVAAAVFATRASQPVDVVLAELIAQLTTPDFVPDEDDEDLRRIAESISAGLTITFVQNDESMPPSS